MANRRSEGGMPAEPRGDTQGMTGDRDEQTGEDVRGIGEETAGDEDFEETEDLDESEEEDEDEEGSF